FVGFHRVRLPTQKPPQCLCPRVAKGQALDLVLESLGCLWGENHHTGIHFRPIRPQQQQELDFPLRAPLRRDLDAPFLIHDVVITRVISRTAVSVFWHGTWESNPNFPTTPHSSPFCPTRSTRIASEVIHSRGIVESLNR